MRWDLFLSQRILKQNGIEGHPGFTVIKDNEDILHILLSPFEKFSSASQQNIDWKA